jgi:hypothetical protein
MPAKPKSESKRYLNNAQRAALGLPLVARRSKPRPICSISGCGKQVLARNLCQKHYSRQYKHGNTETVLSKRDWEPGEFRVSLRSGYKMLYGENQWARGEHLLIAEKALGSPLPKGAQVHHVDENPLNNDPTNLVICPNQAYHSLLHQRQRAYDASGHADWLRCPYCKTHDDPNNLYVQVSGKNIGQSFHRACRNSYSRNRSSENG